MSPPSSNTIICDAHVHIYNCFDLDVFFDSAWHNFYKQAQALGAQAEFSAILLLSEAKQDCWFSKLKEGGSLSNNWRFTPTSEATTLMAQHTDGRKMFIVSGRQIVTSENLEVLALATTNTLADGKPISEVVDWVMEQKAIPVIPWGFGKWWGGRGNVLSNTLSNITPNNLFLGDNSGRPWFLGKPKHFAVAETDNRRILPGSDPLPFASEANRPGSVGFSYIGILDESAPTKSLHSYLKDPKNTVTNYMHCESLIPFLKNQIAMQIKKRT